MLASFEVLSQLRFARKLERADVAISAFCASCLQAYGRNVLATLQVLTHQFLRRDADVACLAMQRQVGVGGLNSSIRLAPFATRRACSDIRAAGLLVPVHILIVFVRVVANVFTVTKFCLQSGDAAGERGNRT